MLTLGSLFDGIGGWLLAAEHNGVKPVWSSEIEKFPMAVSKHHFPEVEQLGDITKIDGANIKPVDIICAGSPCQDLSLAQGGNRKGLQGERSGLFRTAISIVRQMRMSTGGGDNHNFYAGKTCRVHIPATQETILEVFWNSSQRPKFQYLRVESGQTPEWLNATDVKLHGAQLTLNFTEYPKDAAESSLSAILEDTVPPKYFLSKAACKGILTRSSKKGKPLPDALRVALERQANAMELIT